MDIRILPSNIANMIAAGEVVQRPASVVKELVENAIDAGATKIDVIVKDAGRTSVQVIDNGCGMTPDQAVICFQRHATSKIASAEDLNEILTFGFRGEALPSIAAVAEVTMTTRTAGQDVGVRVTITDATSDDPGRQNICEVAAPVGTNFIVSNLYYNTPARRKFLKSDASELRQIISEFTKLALSRPDITFSLTSGEKNIFKLAPAANLLFRIRDIYGAGTADSLIPLQADTSAVRISGFVSRPESSHKTVVPDSQRLFVNSRYFRSPYIHKAVMTAYDNIIPQGNSPAYFIFLDVDPHSVDINVHPTKTEVKFEDDSVLFTVVMATIKEALGRETFGERLDFEAASLPSIHNIASSFDQYRPVSEPAFAADNSYNPFEGDGFPNRDEWGDIASAVPPMPEVVEETPVPRSPVLVYGRHIVTKVHNGILLADSQKAMQRILYEEFLQAISENTPLAQRILFPVEVEVGPTNLPVLEANAELLQHLGFDFAPFSANTILVNAVPDGLMEDRMAISALMYEIISILGQEQNSLAASMYSSLAERLSCSAARSANLPTDSDMARTLLDRLYSTDNPEFTPDGHRILSILTPENIDKLLK